MNIRNLTLFLLGVWGLSASMIAAADPSTLHIGSGYGTSCATGGCPLYNSEVNGFSDHLSIYQESGGAGALNDPLYLILGAVNDTSPGVLLNSSMFGNATLESDNSVVTVGSLTFQGLMASGDEAYTVAGFSPAPNNSNSFVNWSGWEQAVLGIDAHNFGIYTLALGTSEFAANDMIDLALNNLPLGTFALAYGESTNPDKHYGTPFTESGLARVPEPSTLMLLGLGVLGLCMSRGRSAKR